MEVDLRKVLRKTPDSIVMGEIRGKEAGELLMVLSKGTPNRVVTGTMSTAMCSRTPINQR